MSSNQVIPIPDMERLAMSMVKSGFYGIKTVDQALILMSIAQAEGRHPATVAQDYDVIQGRPAKKPQAMLRDFLSAGGTVKWHALDDTQADATFSHPAGGTFRCTWDLERAKRAGLVGKENWKNYPRAMLRSRCVSEGIRTVFPGATSGTYTPEEVRDLVDVTPAEPAPVDVTPDPADAEAAASRLADSLVAIREADDLQSLKLIFRAAHAATKRLGDSAAMLELEAAKERRKLELTAEEPQP